MPPKIFNFVEIIYIGFYFGCVKVTGLGSADDRFTFSITMVEIPVTADAAPSPIPVAESPRLRPTIKGARTSPRMLRVPDAMPVEEATTWEMVQSLCTLSTLSASSWSFLMLSFSSCFT